MHRRISRAWLSVAAALVLASCFPKQEMDNKFGDQHFKTVVALVELHKLRYGSYPASLADLRYVGDWDRIALSSVEYGRLPDGYALNLVRGWVGQPHLEYPPDFWQGLGLRQSNVKPAPPAT